MGFWDFLHGSGKKLETETPDAAPTPAVLKKEVSDLGLDTTGLEIKVEGDKVKLEGQAVSPEVKEKVILAVGNVQGVASVEAEDEPGAPAPRFHTVKKGETLSHIAKAELGHANRYMDIFEANKPMLSHPDKIYPGQVLRIPQSA
jgi:nucleoid-associated protein YgaU